MELLKKIVSFILTLAMLLSSSAYLLTEGVDECGSLKVFRDVSAKSRFKGDVDSSRSQGGEAYDVRYVGL